MLYLESNPGDTAAAVYLLAENDEQLNVLQRVTIASLLGRHALRGKPSTKQVETAMSTITQQFNPHIGVEQARLVPKLIGDQAFDANLAARQTVITKAATAGRLSLEAYTDEWQFLSDQRQQTAPYVATHTGYMGECEKGVIAPLLYPLSERYLANMAADPDDAASIKTQGLIMAYNQSKPTLSINSHGERHPVLAISDPIHTELAGAFETIYGHRNAETGTFTAILDARGTLLPEPHVLSQTHMLSTT